MKNRTFAKILCCFCAMLTFGNSFGQVDGYQRLFNSNSRDIVSTCNTPTDAGGYYLVSIFNEPSTIQADSVGIMVSKHDPKGDVITAFDYIIEDATFSLSGKAIECQKLLGDTLVIVAIDESSRTEESKKFVLKLDEIGQVIWQATIQDTMRGMPLNPDYEANAKLVSIREGEYTYYGNHDDDRNPNSTESNIGVHMIHFDKMNRPSNRQSFIGVTADTVPNDFINITLRDAAPQRDSSTVLTMATPDDGTQAAIARLDSLGEPIQAQLYKIDDVVEYEIEFTAITETVDKGFVSVGYCFHNFISEGIVVKLDSALNVSWAKRISLEGAGAINEAQDVVVSATGDIVVAGRYVTSAFESGNYAIFLGLDGLTTHFPVKYESENSLTVEFTSGYSSNVHLSNSRADMTMIMSTTGASNSPLGLSPLLIKMTQEGAAMCHDSLLNSSLDDISFIKDTLHLITGHLGVIEELETRVKPANYDVPVLVLGQTAYCPREDTIHVFDATTDGAASYLWSTGDTTETLAVDMGQLEAGDTEEYAVTITMEDRICYILCDTGAVSKTQFPEAFLGLDNSDYCEFNTVDLIVRSSNGTSGGIEWSTNNPQDTTNTITVTPVAGAMYSVTITDGCGDTAAAEITLPDLAPDPNLVFDIDNSALCDDGVLFVTASWPGNPYTDSGLTYSWSPGGETTPQITVDAAGNYAVTITDGCLVPHVAMGMIDIDDELIIPPPSIVINQSELQSFGNGLCGLRLTAVGTIDPVAATIPGVDLVHSGDVNLTLDVTSVNPNPQTFNAIVTQCGVDYSDEVTISEADLDVPDPTVSITREFNSVTCEIVLTADGSVAIGPGQFSWSNNVLGNQSTVTMPGTYMVTLTDACGQTAEAAITVTQANFAEVDNFFPVIASQSDTSDCSVLLAVQGVPDGASYMWSTGETSPFISVTEEGVYTVTVELCERTETLSYERTIADEFTWPNIFFPVVQIHDRNNSFGPKVDCIETKTEPYLLEVYNRWGKKVFVSENPAERWRGTLNNQGQFLEEDVYMYQCTYAGELIEHGHVTLVRSSR